MAERGGADAPPAAGPPAGAKLAGAALAGARQACRAVVSARTWLAVIHLMAGTVTGVAAFAVIAVLAVAGVGTVWFFLAGLPLLVTMLRLALLFARAERARFAVTLGVVIPAPPADPGEGGGWWRRARRLMAARTTRRQFGYAVLRLPLSLAEAAIVALVWSLAVALLGLRLLGWLLYGVVVPHSPRGLAVTTALGLILLLSAPQLTRGLAAADIAIARYLIGPDLTGRIGELERSRARVVDAAEAERRRIERDLHDGAQQRLVSLAMNLGRAKARFASDPDGAIAIVGQAHTEAKQALAELRSLVRGVHPPVLTDRGLDAAISGLAALCPVPVAVHAELDTRPAAPIEAIAYFVVSEALTNVAKHARATRAEVSIARHDDVLRVMISDDGGGGAEPRGQGLSGLADRITGVDGRLSVRSPAGGPTVIEVELPCGS